MRLFFQIEPLALDSLFTLNQRQHFEPRHTLLSVLYIRHTSTRRHNPSVLRNAFHHPHRTHPDYSLIAHLEEVILLFRKKRCIFFPDFAFRVSPIFLAVAPVRLASGCSGPHGTVQRANDVHR